jgi:hypothetical protein
VWRICAIRSEEGTIRLPMRLYYRALNKLTVKNKCPIPLKDDLFDLTKAHNISHPWTSAVAINRFSLTLSTFQRHATKRDMLGRVSGNAVWTLKFPSTF